MRFDCGLRIAECGFTAKAALLAVTLGVVGVAQAQTADDVVAKVEKHYQTVNDLSATVSQKNFLKSVGKTQKFEGTLAVKKPGKLRLEYTNGQVIVIDGKEAWFYSRKNEQAMRRTFRDFEAMNVPVAFLLGAGHIRESFEVTPAAADQPAKIDLTPKKADAAMKKLRLETDAAGAILVLTVYDRNGNISEVAFSGVRENVGVDDARFRFKAPKGTEIIEQ